LNAYSSISALVAHYYIVNGDDLECCLRRPAANHKPFTQLSQDEQVSQLRRMHTITPRTKTLPSATSSWYQIGVGKFEALEILQNKPNGSFVVRNSAYPNWLIFKLWLLLTYFDLNFLALHLVMFATHSSSTS
jgi:hypothetical protein